MTTDLGPGENDLGRRDRLALGLGEALGDGLDVGLVDQEGHANVVVSKGGVSRDQDVLLGAVVDHGGVGQPGVALNLVNRRNDTGVVDDSLELPDELGT